MAGSISLSGRLARQVHRPHGEVGEKTHGSEEQGQNHAWPEKSEL